MNTFGKRLFIAIAIPVVLLVIAAVLAVLLVDADTIKKRLDTELVEQTGQHLRIDGDISLQLFPLAIKITRAELRSDGKKQAWFKVNRIAGQIDLLRLFSGALVIDSFIIDKPKINLDAAQFPESRDSKQKPEQKKPAAKNGKDSAPLLIGVRQVKISQGTLNWGKTAKDGQLDIHSLTASNVAPGEPIHFRFDVVAHSPEVPHAVPVKGDMKIDFSKADLLKIKPINIKLDQSNIDGKLTVNSKQGTHIDFDFNMDQLNVDRYTQPAGKPAGKTAAKPAVKSAGKGKSSSGSSDVIITGSLALKKLDVTGLSITDTKTQVRFANDVLKLTGFSSHISDGTVKGSVTVNLKGAQPAISLDQKLTDIQVGKLLKDLKIYDHFSGKGDIMLKLATRGNDIDPILKNLNGDVSFKLGESSFNDTDLLATAQKYKKIYATLKGKEVEDKPVSSKTAYDHVSGSFKFTNGTGNTNDLLITRTDAYISGSGTLNPALDTINIYLNVGERKQDQNTDRMIPLRIKGKLSDPKIRLDSKAIKKEAKKAIKKETKKKAKEKLRRSLDRYLNR